MWLHIGTCLEFCKTLSRANVFSNTPMVTSKTWLFKCAKAALDLILGLIAQLDTPSYSKNPPLQRYHWDTSIYKWSSRVPSFPAALISFKTPPNTCRLFSRPISAIFNVFSFFLSPIYLLSLPPPLSLSISPFGLNSWCTIFVSVHCSLPGLSLSLSFSLVSLLSSYMVNQYVL